MVVKKNQRKATMSEEINRLHLRMDNIEQRIVDDNKQTNTAINELTKQVTILVTQWQETPRYIQPCKFFQDHLAEQKDWKNRIVEWIGSFTIALLLLYIGWRLGSK
jgi:hypothetical protein